MKSWLEDLFYLVAFVVAVGLATLSVYAPPASEASLPAADHSGEPSN